MNKFLHSLLLLQISVKDIRILASYYNWHYAPMHKALSQIIKKGLESIQGQGQSPALQGCVFKCTL